MDIDDIMYTSLNSCCYDLPSNVNPRDEALLCMTDLERCCGTEVESRTVQLVHGDWHYPGGDRVGFNFNFESSAMFLENRGPNGIINGQTVYGSVRLFRRYNPPERGCFYCELPSRATPSVNQTLYVNICEFLKTRLILYNYYCSSHAVNIGAVNISPSGHQSCTAGGNASLVCSTTIMIQEDTPSPHFQWFFGPNNNSLPFWPPMTTNSGTPTPVLCGFLH